QHEADALLEAVGPPVELVPAVEPRRRGLLLEGILLGDHLLEHGPERHPEPGDRVPKLLLEGLALLGGAHTVWSSSTAATVRPVSNVRPAAPPRTAPPAGIGGTGNPPSKPCGVSSRSSSSSVAWSPKKKTPRN